MGGGGGAVVISLRTKKTFTWSSSSGSIISQRDFEQVTAQSRTEFHFVPVAIFTINLVAEESSSQVLAIMHLKGFQTNLLVEFDGRHERTYFFKNLG